MKIFGKALRIIFSSALMMMMSMGYDPVNAQVCTGPTVKPTINVSANSLTICTGSQAKFYATVTNCGANPSFQWKVNGVNAGTNSDSFYTTSLKDKDNVICIVTADPSFTCASPNKVSSFGLVINVSSASPASITVSPSANDVCPGAQVIFSASAQNASSSLSYQWKLNGANVGSNSPTYTGNHFSDNDEVYCMLVDSNSCSTDSIQSNIVAVTLKSLPVITINPGDTAVSPGSTVKLNVVVDGTLSSFTWMPSQSLSDPTSLSPVTIPILATTSFVFNAVSGDGCNVSQKAVINILHNLYMPNAFTPNGDSHNDVFRIPPKTDIKTLNEFSIYNRWGSKVFSTTDISKGWDGNVNGRKQSAGVYVYVINAVAETGKFVFKGSFVLVR